MELFYYGISSNSKYSQALIKEANARDLKESNARDLKDQLKKILILGSITIISWAWVLLVCNNYYIYSLHEYAEGIIMLITFFICPIFNCGGLIVLLTEIYELALILISQIKNN